MDTAKIRDHYRRMQTILSKMCVKYNAPPETALLQHRKYEFKNVIQREQDAMYNSENAIATMEDEIIRIDEIRGECQTYLTAFSENSAEHIAAQRRLQYLDKLPKFLRDEKSHLKKNKN